MRRRIYTVHHRPGRELEVIADAFSLLALLVPVVWAIWHRAWVTLGVVIVFPALVGLADPGAAAPVFWGIAVLLALEGGAVRRAELSLWSWQEVGCVLAATEEGAEELFVSGQVG